MGFIEVMQDYFRGERLEALWFIAPAGALLVGLGLVALRAESGGFAWGVAVPSFVVGLVLLGTGIGVAARTPKQVAALERRLHEAPAAMVREELPRMRQVNDNWKYYLGASSALVVVGLLLRLFVRADWAWGAGPALVLAGAIGLLIDGFAERRAIPYTAALEELAETTSEASPRDR